jgi:hypothetical protein
MIGIIELPKRVKTSTKRILDSQEDFFDKINKSHFVTYTLEYFTSCFHTERVQVKAINIQLFILEKNMQPKIKKYMISWEDIPKDPDDSWLEFQANVDMQLRQFLSDLKNRANIIENSM